jgi:preprotein translocase subunit SecA
VYDFLRPCTRKEAYNAHITYGTNSEFGFDYLRDNIAYGVERVVQRKHSFAIVDEVDSILIDEARTPLIISAPIGKNESLYPTFAKIAETLQKKRDYTVDEKQKAIQLTDSGIEKAEKALGVENIYTEKGIKYVHHLETAVRAKALFERDRDYVVRDGEVVIVDHFTGRLQPGRRWSEGLHQAIEAKEGVVIKEESRTFASVSYQNYFKLYKKLSGMTGTALTSAEEFVKVYGLETISIPPHRPMARIDHDDLIFQTENGKFTAVARKIKELNEEGRPVLVGTVSIEKSELLSKILKTEGVSHQVLNAKNHEQEGEIIANAGRKRSVTIATNMAGRGVDIKLGGAKATNEEYEEIKALGGLYVLGTERHEARRIDNQLRGRSGRQGDPGETQFFISLEDTLMRIFAPERIKNMMGRFGIPEDEPIKNNLISKAIESAQSKIEGLNFDARKHLLEYDDVLNHQRKIIYEKRRKILEGKKEDLEEVLEKMIISSKEEGVQEKIEERKKALGEDPFWSLFRVISLQSLDMLWIEHLETMDYMRGSVNLRAYGQRDPLVEYKREGLRIFKELESAITENILHIIPHIGKVEKKGDVEMKSVEEGANILTSAQNAPTHSHKKQEKVGRNDPCPCGSGKKYKKCHGK